MLPKNTHPLKSYTLGKPNEEKPGLKKLYSFKMLLKGTAAVCEYAGYGATSTKLVKKTSPVR